MSNPKPLRVFAGLSGPGSLVLVAVGLGLTALAGWRASRLVLRTELEALLPRDQPSVVEMQHLRERLRGVSNVFVVLEGAETARLRAAGDAVAAGLRKVGTPWIGEASSGVHEARDFLLPRAGLFASVENLESLAADIEEARRRAYGARIGADLSDEPAPSITASRLSSMLDRRAAEASRLPGGYFQSQDGRAVVVRAVSLIQPDQVAAAAEALRRIHAAVGDTLASHPGVRAGFAGDLVTGQAEYNAIRTDLMHVGVAGVLMVLGIIMIFYLRVRPVVLLGFVVLQGCVWTFGLTQLVFGEVTTASGFLFSVVAGNGINFGIILQSRYYEGRSEGLGVEGALTNAIVTTWRPTLAAAVAGAGAYGALGVTSFPAFQQFALVGGSGILLCWMATFGMLPAMLGFTERVRPTTDGGRWAGWRRKARRFDAPWTAMVFAAPRTVLGFGVVLTLAGAGLTAKHFFGQPLEMDMRKLENDKSLTAELYRISHLARDILGAGTESAMVVLADRLEDVRALEGALERRKAAVPHAERPFEDVVSIYDFVPEKQEEKLPLLATIRKRLERARELGAIEDKEWDAIAPYLPPEGLRPFGPAELPVAVRGWFTEKDGTVGRVLYVEPTIGRNDGDLAYLRLFADAYREVTLPSGKVVHGSGRAVIFADLLDGVWANGPRAFGLSVLLTVLALGLAFRRMKDAALAGGALIVGLLWLGGVMALADLKIHFINFAAIPVTIGIGADYAVNILVRARQIGRTAGAAGAVRAAMVTAGGPVVLCSLTTTLAYLALVTSSNQGVRGLGLIAVIGEVTCLAAALLILPAVLIVGAGRERQARDAEPAGDQAARAAS